MQTRILGTLLLGTFSFTGQAAGLAVESMTITGGSLLFNQPNLGIAGCDSNPSWRCLTPGPSALIDDSIPGDGAMDADGLLGTPTNPVVSGSLIDGPIYGYFSHSGSPGYVDPDPDGLTAVVETGTGLITADFSGFFFSWAGTDFLAGGTATGQTSPISVDASGVGQYAFLVSWTFVPQGTVGENWMHVNLSGTLVTAVPEVDNYALFLAGLGVVGFAARKRVMAFASPHPI